MDTNHIRQEMGSDNVIEIAGEPAIVINGVPVIKSSSMDVACDTAPALEDPFFGEWLEGRKVRKLFGDQYYSGEVVKYERESNWYKVVYEDGDVEDLEWHELEGVLIPLDLSIPLKALAIERFNFGKIVSVSGSKFTPKTQAKKMKLCNASESTSIPSEPVLLLKAEETTQGSVEAKDICSKESTGAGSCALQNDSYRSNCVEQVSALANSSLQMVLQPDGAESESPVMACHMSNVEASRKQKEIHITGMVTSLAEKQKRREAQSSRA